MARPSRSPHLLHEEPESRLNAIVEGVQCHALITGFARVQVERQDIVRVEADFNGVKVGKCSHEKHCAEHEQARKSDLGDDKNAFQADGAARSHNSGSSFQGRSDLDARGFEGRRQSEQDSRTHCNCTG